MLTLEDCIGVCDFTEEEIEAICIHEHIPEVAAIELAEYIIEGEDGVPGIKRIIMDDIEEAKAAGDMEMAEKLDNVLKHFIATHPYRTLKKAS